MDFVKDLALLQEAIDWIRSFLDDEQIGRSIQT